MSPSEYLAADAGRSDERALAILDRLAEISVEVEAAIRHIAEEDGWCETCRGHEEIRACHHSGVCPCGTVPCPDCQTVNCG